MYKRPVDELGLADVITIVANDSEEDFWNSLNGDYDHDIVGSTFEHRLLNKKSKRFIGTFDLGKIVFYYFDTFTPLTFDDLKMGLSFVYELEVEYDRLNEARKRFETKLKILQEGL